jgi:cytochrome c oxidase subunit 3
VYLPTTLHSSFLYVLTGIHGIHLAGGVIGMGFVLYKSFQGQLATRPEALKLCALYWHFMDLVWVYVFVLLVLA